jgi:hypothetical protein
MALPPYLMTIVFREDLRLDRRRYLGQIVGWHIQVQIGQLAHGWSGKENGAK